MPQVRFRAKAKQMITAQVPNGFRAVAAPAPRTEKKERESVWATRGPAATALGRVTGAVAASYVRRGRAAPFNFFVLRTNMTLFWPAICVFFGWAKQQKNIKRKSMRYLILAFFSFFKSCVCVVFISYYIKL